MVNANATNTPELVSDGQVMIGATGADPTSSTITAGSGVTITNAANSITVAANPVVVQQVYGEQQGLLTLTTPTPVPYTNTSVFAYDAAGEVFRVSITPTSGANDLLFEVTVQAGQATDGSFRVMGLFQDEAGNALAVAMAQENREVTVPLTMRLRINAVDTTARNYDICVAGSGAGNIFINGRRTAPNDLYSGAGISAITVTEIATSVVPSPAFWVNVPGVSQTMAENTGYVAANAGTVAFTLPATPAFGDELAIAGQGSGGTGAWTLTQSATQLVHVDGASTTVGAGAKVASTNLHDSLRLVCSVGGVSSEFITLNQSGTLTVT